MKIWELLGFDRGVYHLAVARRRRQYMQRDALRLQVIHRDGLTCRVCGVQICCCWHPRCRDAGQVDHIQPVAVGGANKLDNLRVVCKPCNRANTPMAWLTASMAEYDLEPEEIAVVVACNLESHSICFHMLMKLACWPPCQAAMNQQGLAS